MAHTFRKYTSNRGSALFMVISTMTALFISCMAMYFSMVSARSSQFAMFNKMQANQSAMSILQIVRTALSTPGDPLFEEAKDLQPGESITTDSNGFMSLDPNMASLLDEDQVGSYSVTITCIGTVSSGGKTFPKVDIMVITSVDGNRQSVHTTAELGQKITFGGGTNGSGGDAELFAATGYVPNDAYIYSGHFLTDVFYDTQYTYIAPFGVDKENRIAQGLSTGGSLFMSSGAKAMIDNDQGYGDYTPAIGPVTYAVRGDLYFYMGDQFGLRGGSEVLVGGDLIKPNGDRFFQVYNNGYSGGTLPDHYCIYVNGDFNYSNSDIIANTWIFVNGNVYGMGNNPVSNTRIYVTGRAHDGMTAEEDRAAKVTNCNKNGNTIREWPIDGTFADGMTYTEFIKKLNEKTATIPYYKWDLSENTKDSVAQHINIRLNTSNETLTDSTGTYAPGTNAYVISYDEDTSSADLIKNGTYPGVFGNSFVIDSVHTKGDSSELGQAIIIDTGDDEDNVITIKLSVLDPDNPSDPTKGVFAWFVDYDWTGQLSYPRTLMGEHPRLLLYRGRGTVLIDVPEGVTYQDSEHQQTVHQSMFLAEGGKILPKTYNGKNIYEFKLKPDVGYGDKVIKYVHKHCNTDDPSDGCHITYSPITKDESKNDTFCMECGSEEEELMQVHCDIHGDVNVYCPKCYPNAANRKDWCVNRMDVKAFENFYNTTLKNTDQEVYAKDSKGIIPPNVNFMLVSCEESADMLFSTRKSGTYDWEKTISSNSFFGFVYAPYITFHGEGGAIGKTVKIFGGMTVSDYNFDSTHAYISCYPDKMPNQIAAMEGGIGGNMSGGPLAGASKSWKIEFGGIS